MKNQKKTTKSDARTKTLTVVELEQLKAATGAGIGDLAAKQAQGVSQ